MPILVIFTVYRLCAVKWNSWTDWLFPYFWGTLEFLSNNCHVLQFHFRWEWAEVELRGDMEPSLLRQNVSYRLEFQYCCFWACPQSLQCFALLHVLLNNTGAGTEQGGGVLVSGIPLLIVMQSLSADTQCQHMSCQQMIFQLLLK